MLSKDIPRVTKPKGYTDSCYRKLLAISERVIDEVRAKESDDEATNNGKAHAKAMIKFLYTNIGIYTKQENIDRSPIYRYRAWHALLQSMKMDCEKVMGSITNVESNGECREPVTIDGKTKLTKYYEGVIDEFERLWKGYSIEHENISDAPAISQDLRDLLQESLFPEEETKKGEAKEEEVKN
jgi:hypothetical protein